MPKISADRRKMGRSKKFGQAEGGKRERNKGLWIGLWKKESGGFLFSLFLVGEEFL